MFGQSLFDEFDADGSTRHGLPAAAYVDDAFLQLENRYLFGNGWVFAGFAHHFARAGDVKPIEVAGMPLFLLCDNDGEIAAFHNLCRHRNLKLIDADGNCGKLIRCPYHSWSYDLCGKLKNAPYFGGSMRQVPPGFEFAEHGLHAVACARWHDWIFVNLSPRPYPFEDFLAPIKRQLGAVDASDYVPVATLDFGEVACNWKLLLENFIEPYHVQFVHQTTTEQPLENHSTVIDEHCVGSAVELSAEQTARARAGALGVTSHYLTLFPLFVMGTYQPDQMGVYLHQPLSAQCTRQTRVIYTHRESNYSDAQIRQLTDLWQRVHLEDHAMCQRMQQGRYSPRAADGGVLSPCWENSVRRFQEMVADSIRPALNTQR